MTGCAGLLAQHRGPFRLAKAHDGRRSLDGRCSGGVTAGCVMPRLTSERTTTVRCGRRRWPDITVPRVLR